MTVRTYASAEAFKQALEQRLRTSASTGPDFARRRQLLVFDRFLARIVAVLGVGGGMPLRIYPVETHLAEKLHAYTMPRKRPNSRIKDLPDIALLAGVKAVASHRLRAALEQTFRFRKTHDLPAALPRCDAAPVERVAWAEPYQRQTRRLQQRLAVEAASMPVMHVAALHGLSWLTVRRSEERAIERWEATRPAVPLCLVGVDEKWLGRRHKLDYKFITIVSNLETGEPIWIGKGRAEETLKRWLQSLSETQKATIQLFAMDMLRAYWNAVDNTRGLEHAAIVHDPFHVLKLAGQMLDELRRDVFFRAGPELRAIGRGKRWLLL